MKGNLLIPKTIVRGGYKKYMEGEVAMPMIGFRGHFHVELISRAGIIKQVLDFHNLITNDGLDKFNTLNIGSCATYAGVGTGSTAPAVTDSALVAEITPTATHRTSANGGITVADSYVVGPPDAGQRKITYLFDFSQANGNLTEIGLFENNSTGKMWTRQLLKDGTGTPTTVVKTVNDQLRVTYTIQIIPPQADVVSGTITISGVDYVFTTRAANVGTATWNTNLWGTNVTDQLNGGNTEAFDNVMGARTASNTGTGNQFTTSHSFATYTNGNFYRDVTVVWGATSGNFAGGIKSFAFYCSAGRFMQMGVAPAIMKTNVKALTLVYRWSWGRYP